MRATRHELLDFVSLLRRSCGSECARTRDGVVGCYLARRVNVEIDVGTERINVFFFFQAEDGIRDLTVTGVQTCALPIFTVGGGVRRVEDVRRLLNAGADNVSINTAAVENPELVREASSIVGNQCIVVAIDAKRVSQDAQNRPARWEVFTHGGRRAAGRAALQCARRPGGAGAGGGVA